MSCWLSEPSRGTHRNASTPDVYAPFTLGYLGRALVVTGEIIERIEKLTPGAFAPAYERRSAKA